MLSKPDIISMVIFPQDFDFIFQGLFHSVKKLLLELKDKQEQNKMLYKDQYEHKYDDYICVDDLGYRRNPETISAHFRLILEKKQFT